MFLFNTYVFFTLGVTLLISIKLVHLFRDELTGMNGMILSMYLGMNIGLTSGILLGAVFRGDLLLSTILSMLIGAAAGTLIGVLFSAGASIEGLMSGIMGGMMGAMLGEMLEPEKSLILINIFLTISMAALFLFKILPQSGSGIAPKKYIMKPLLTLLLLVFYLYLGSQLGHTWIESLTGSNHQQEHLHHP